MWRLVVSRSGLLSVVPSERDEDDRPTIIEHANKHQIWASVQTSDLTHRHADNVYTIPALARTLDNDEALGYAFALKLHIEKHLAEGKAQ